MPEVANGTIALLRGAKSREKKFICGTEIYSAFEDIARLVPARTG